MAENGKGSFTKRKSTKKNTTTKRSSQSKSRTVKSKSRKQSSNTKSQRNRSSKSEKKTYLKVGVGILSVCVILILTTFFVLPTLKRILKDDVSVVSSEKPVVVNTKPEQTLQQQPLKEKKQPQPAKTEEKPKPVETSKIVAPKKTAQVSKTVTKNDVTAKPEKPVPPVPHKGVLVFVFDDAGHNLKQLQAFLDLPFNCVIAVLPGRAHSAEAARRIRDAGKEVILHQPMQAIDESVNPGYGALKPEMTREEVIQTLKANIAEIAPIAGLNNHEGSLITENKTFMKIVLEVAREEGIYFLDSRTTAKTVVPSVAKEMGMVIWERAVFLDNIKEKTAMKTQIERGFKIAEKNGYAILIGHVFTTELAELLTQMYPDIKAAGFSLATISEVANGL
ncbi:MAG: hypothetical protein CR988_00835 [Treponema sp.]|nr:MAG: hypothetical protein CR988_00835 [Treponema sp.]